MTTVIHKNSTTAGVQPTGLVTGQLALNSADRVVYTPNASGVTTKVFDQYSKTEADAAYIPTGILPISRIGDTPYLPLDVKGDFKGAVVPTYATYMLRESDSSVVGLRPGYNGNIEQVFYFYSKTGRVEVEADFTYTDTVYTPNFLRNDGTVVEYVRLIRCCNQWGFLAGIGSKLDSTYRRWYWIFTNGTLDPLFHSYVDITDTMKAADIASIVYVKEFNGFVGVMNNKLQLLFYNANLPTNTVNVPAPTSTTLTTKSVNCVDPISGTTAAAISFLNYDGTNYSAIYKPINSGQYVHQSTKLQPGGNYNMFTVVYQLSDDQNTLSMFLPLMTQSSYTIGDQYCNIIVRLRYTISTNTIRWYLQSNDAANQTLPFVFDPSTYGTANNTSAGDPTSDAYKLNKYPVIYARVPDGSPYFPGTVDSSNFIDSTTIATVSNTYNFYQFGLANIDVSASTATNKLTSYTDRPYMMQGNSSYSQTKRSSIVFYPYDASVLGKHLVHASFLSRYKLGVDTLSRQYGTVLASNSVMVTFPSVDINRTLDTASTPNALPLPASSMTLSSVPGATGIPELVNYYHFSNTILYSNGDFRIMPYGGESAPSLLPSNLNGLVVKVIDADALAYDTSRGGVSGVAIFPTDTTTKLATLALAYATSSTCNFTTPSTTAKKMCMHYIGDYTNGGVTYGLCLFQYIIQEVGSKTELGWVTLRLRKTGTQMAFSTDPASDVVSVSKITDVVTTTGNINTPSYGQPTIGILQYTDGRFFIHARGCARGQSAAILNYYSLMEVAADGTIGRTKLAYDVANTYAGANAGLHPDIGPLSYASRQDYSQARISFNSWPNATSGAVARNYAVFNGVLGGTTSLTPSTNWLLTVESAQGFNLYVSQFSSFLAGRVYNIPTMTIDLTNVTANPANTTFYVYLHAIADTRINMEILTAPVDEAFDIIFVGTVTTNATSISDVSLSKTTRLDLYRPSHKQYVGSSMPIPV